MQAKSAFSAAVVCHLTAEGCPVLTNDLYQRDELCSR